MLTLADFEKIKEGEIFKRGVAPNSPAGIFMTRQGGELRWLAVKGEGNDWAIYCHWSNRDEHFIRWSGDKVTDFNTIQKLVPCVKEVLDLYRK